jgi:hypothetical protein
MRTAPLFALALLAACGQPDAPPESDAHAVMDPERDVHIELDGQRFKVTNLDGAEDSEAVSPDGAWVAFVGGDTGIASVWAAPIPRAGEPPATPMQLTNVDLHKAPREVGKPPAGFVPPPDRGVLRWKDDRTVAWTAGGVEYTAQVPL